MSKGIGNPLFEGIFVPLSISVLERVSFLPCPDCSQVLAPQSGVPFSQPIPLYVGNLSPLHGTCPQNHALQRGWDFLFPDHSPPWRGPCLQCLAPSKECVISTLPFSTASMDRTLPHLLCPSVEGSLSSLVLTCHGIPCPCYVPSKGNSLYLCPFLSLEDLLFSSHPPS